MKKHLIFIIPSIILIGGWLILFQIKNSFAEETATCPSHSHLSGTECICDNYYKAEGGECVPMSASEICPVVHSHQVGDQCVCDDRYKSENGQCVPMTGSDLCPMAHSHVQGDMCYCDSGYKPKDGQCVVMTIAEMCGSSSHVHVEGDQCHCDEGYGTPPGSKNCVSKTAYCSVHNAHYNASTDDCDCNEGYKDNKADTDCVVDPDKPKEDTDNKTTPEEQKAVVDPLETKIILKEKEDDKVNFSAKTMIDASTKDMNKDEKKTIKAQEEAIKSLKSLNEDVVELSASKTKQMNVMYDIATKIFKEKLIKYEKDIKGARATHKLKNEKDKPVLEKLLKEEGVIKQSLQNNKEAWEIHQKQYIVVEYNNEPFGPNMFANDPTYKPSRDFMKEANNDIMEARVRVAETLAADSNQAGKLKDDLRSKEKEIDNLLDKPAKPNFEEELKKVKVNWYQQK